MEIDFSIIWPYMPVLMQGLWVTVAITLGCAIAGSLLGFVVSLGRMVNNVLVSGALKLYVEFFRGTPLLIQLFWIFFCFPVVLGISIPPYVSVIISLTLYMGAITSETFRGSLKSIEQEQHDACTALGLKHSTKVIYIIFPQALLRAIPPLLSNIVSLFKESALISSVGIADLMFIGQNISNSTAHPVEFLTTVAIIYFVVAFPLTRLVGYVESRMLTRYAI
ncbi:amino acid ABC transporter permease [Oceanobacter kriegii]|uniref:amino acid ABC transporter permease n=1 Tax=Oceanobacter kriegii TaxID=64972 RepID=UPI000406D21B|nr:amino acid ABC transporter permease [Oceanobacter kriegii]